MSSLKERDNNEPESLVKDIDYYVEGGKFVFTAAYHSKRGFCCENKCRHCPFTQKKRVTTNRTKKGIHY